MHLSTALYPLGHFAYKAHRSLVLSSLCSKVASGPTSQNSQHHNRCGANMYMPPPSPSCANVTSGKRRCFFPCHKNTPVSKSARLAFRFTRKRVARRFLLNYCNLYTKNSMIKRLTTKTNSTAAAAALFGLYKQNFILTSKGNKQTHNKKEKSNDSFPKPETNSDFVHGR